MAQASLHDLCKATLITQITYASPALNGFLSVADRNRLQSIVTKAKRFGYLPANYDSFDQLCANADEKLFLTCVTTLTTSVINSFLPSNALVTTCGHAVITTLSVTTTQHSYAITSLTECCLLICTDC